MSRPRIRLARILCAYGAVMVLASCGRAVQPPATGTNAETEIREQIGRYAAALNAADIELASHVWRTTPDISMIHPAGHAHGWEEVKQFYAFFGSTFSERALTPRDIVVHVNGDAAWAEFYWHFVGKQRKDGATVQTDGRESQVYNRIDGQWRLVHLHYSGPPMPAS